MARKTAANVARFCDELAALTGEHGDLCNEIGTAALALIAYDYPSSNDESRYVAILSLCQPALTPGRAKEIAKMRKAKP